MLKKNLIILLVYVLATAGIAQAETTASVPSAIAKQTSTSSATVSNTELRTRLATILGLDIVSLKPSPMSGLMEIVTNQGLFYVSNDGQYFVQGKLFGIGDRITNHTEESLATVRIKGMTQFADDMIVFAAENEKHVVTVFTDITCSYCRKLHEQIGGYNDKGITVRYLAYPRAGIRDGSGDFSQGFKALRSVWCHEDPKAALTKAKLGSSIADRICDKPIEEEFNFGRQVGVNGTPALMLSNGMMLPGYQSPEQLAQILDSM